MRKSEKTHIVVAVIWFGAVVACMASLWWYKTRPGGVAAASVSRFPASAGFELDKETPYSLIMFTHPKCDCSAASLYEIRRILKHAGGNVTAKLVFLVPPHRDEKWAQTKLWEEASSVPGITVVMDNGGRMAHRFGARTSGETFLYSQDGKLLFRGGVTESRGHIGESKGGRAIASITTGKPVPGGNPPTFGCALFSISELKALDEEAKAGHP